MLDKRIVFVTGKGGVGRTTIAYALGLRAAADGHRTLVCEVGGQSAVERIFGSNGGGEAEPEVADNLHATSITPEQATREYLIDQLPLDSMGELLHRSRLFSYLTAATPGLAEMVTLGKIWELALPERRREENRSYDLVVVDAPATGHGVGLLETPRTFADLARVGPLARQARIIGKTIADPAKTTAVIVSRPEEMPVNEALSLEPQLRDRAGVDVAAHLVNAVLPKRFTAEELRRLEELANDAGDGPAGMLATAVAEGRRTQMHSEQLERLSVQSGSPVRTVDWLPSPELGRPELETIAGQLR